MHLHGACHCGNIRFQLTREPASTEIPARSCTCSFCAKHGGLWTSCPTGKLQVDIADKSKVSLYRFGTRTADFHICTVCGVVPLVTSRIEGRLYAVVSVHALENLDHTRLRHATADFSSEDEAARLARRQRGWIANVQFREGCGQTLG